MYPEILNRSHRRDHNLLYCRLSHIGVACINPIGEINGSPKEFAMRNIVSVDFTFSNYAMPSPSLKSRLQSTDN